ncbi:hypothetical protein ACFE04_000766 [Oxalis oulophora]
MAIQRDRVKFNVGGRVFETTSTTLANAGRSSYFGSLFDDNWNFQRKIQEEEVFFIDRNPDCFAVLLDLLRTGDLHIPSNVPEKLLYREALENIVISACEKLGSRDGGMGLFGSSNGELKYKFEVCHDNQAKSFAAVNDFDDLGFLDMRMQGGSIRWSSRSRLMKWKMSEEPCYPKLSMRDGQLFSSMNDSISVFCGPDMVLTSRLRRTYGGSICDFSIGGDRLFALHSEENVFDVWETPPPPIL